MILTNSNQLENVIDKLNNLLLEGYFKQRNQRTFYFKNKDSNEFNVNSHIQETTKILNDWYSSVVKILDTELSEKHHLFHFMQHEGSAIMLSGIPMELSNLFIDFEYYLYALEDIVLRLEERKNLITRQEIAEMEHQADILYKITYSEHTREIKLNNLVLARLQFDSKNVNFFEYVYSHQNQQIDIKDIENNTAIEIKDSIHDILRDLGFKDTLRKLFFPIATKSKVMFTNPITKQFAIKNDLPTIDLTKATRQNEK